MTAWTATSNTTTWIGHVIPCPHCTGRDRRAARRQQILEQARRENASLREQVAASLAALHKIAEL